MVKEQGSQDLFMERVKVGEDLLALVVCDTDALAAELQVVGQYFKKPG